MTGAQTATAGLSGQFALSANSDAPKRKRRRSPPFSLRLTADERARLEREAGETPLATYIKFRLFNGLPPLASFRPSRPGGRPATDTQHVHELRGFTADDLEGAFHEAYAVSRATRCKQFLFSLSLNPPPDAKVSTEKFQAAVDAAEERLGLSGHPRAIVFHEKDGRRHCHAVRSRIDPERMRAVNLPFYKTTPDGRITRALP